LVDGRCVSYVVMMMHTYSYENDEKSGRVA
jgi:hypothetical protein